MNEEVILEGRKAVRDFLNAPSEDCIISGESATSILFSLSYALSREMSGNENIVTTEYEHYANASPWLELEERGVVKEVRFARFNPNDGQLDVSHLASLLDKNTRVVSVAGVSNVLGSKTPAAPVFKLAKEVGAYTVLDAVHTVPHISVDVVKLGCDFAVFSSVQTIQSARELRIRPKRVTGNPQTIQSETRTRQTTWKVGDGDTRPSALFLNQRRHGLSELVRFSS